MAPIGKPEDWIFLGGGGFNLVYGNAKLGLVFKEAHHTDLGTDTPERSVRLWNIINPDLKPKAKLATIIVDGKKIHGWTCPYVRTHHHSKTFLADDESTFTDIDSSSIDTKSISTDNESISTENKESSPKIISPFKQDKALYAKAMQDPATRIAEDQAIVTALIDIYNRSGRVIVDAGVPGNFVTTEPSKAVCIDIGMALLLEKKETECLNTYARRPSITSNTAWESVHDEMNNKILNTKNPLLPQTVQMTKVLLFIRTFRPDITNVDFLTKTENQAIIKKLAEAYDSKSVEDHTEATNLLNEIRPVNLITMKEACTKKLLDYIQSRGTLEEGKKFRASWITKNFRNKLLTLLKVDAAQLLIKKINTAQSVDEIQKAINAASNQKILHHSSFKTVLGTCKIISHEKPDDTPYLASQAQIQ